MKLGGWMGMDGYYEVFAFLTLKGGIMEVACMRAVD